MMHFKRFAQSAGLRTLPVVLLLAGLSIRCGVSPEEKTGEPAATTASTREAQQRPAPEDLARYLPKEGLLSNTVVPDNLLGIQELPGGNVAEYAKSKKQFQQFLLKAPNVALAAVYLNEVKSAMDQPKFVASFGGYYGVINGSPVFVFVKNKYVMGLIGLSKEDADTEGRLVAARIP